MYVYMCVWVLENPAALALVGWRLAAPHATPFSTWRTLHYALSFSPFFTFFAFQFHFVFLLLYVFRSHNQFHTFLFHFSCFLPCAHTFGLHVGGFVVVLCCYCCYFIAVFACVFVPQQIHARQEQQERLKILYESRIRVFSFRLFFPAHNSPILAQHRTTTTRKIITHTKNTNNNNAIVRTHTFWSGEGAFVAEREHERCESGKQTAKNSSTNT